MSVRIVAYDEAHVPAVREFNGRLRSKGCEFQFPEHVRSFPSPAHSCQPIHREHFVAVDDTGAVRGGYILKAQHRSSRGKSGPIGNLQLPLSEGVVDPTHAMVGVALIVDCIRRQSRLYCLGMGGIERPLPRMLKKLGWKVELIPFYFHVLAPARFLQEIAFLRSSRHARLALDLLRYSGVGYLSLKSWAGVSTAARRARLRFGRTQARQVADFGPWADEIWNAASLSYDFIGRRDCRTLTFLYPSHDPRFIRLVVEKDDGPIGWAVLLVTGMKAHKQFGSMRVGSLVDCLALPGQEVAVADHAIEALHARRVDVMVSNQSHTPWRRALRLAGFIRGPSNYGFACSKALAAEISRVSKCHLTRGDGDGPINL